MGDMARQWREHDAPGLKRLRRKNGRVDCYWVADEKLVKSGYTPKTVRLFSNPDSPDDYLVIASACRARQAEMLQ
jgi:hypothetical protein